MLIVVTATGSALIHHHRLFKPIEPDQTSFPGTEKAMPTPRSVLDLKDVKAGFSPVLLQSAGMGPFQVRQSK